MVLRSYNAHNDYVMHMSAFNSLHDEFYNKQIYDMLDELQVSESVNSCNCHLVYYGNSYTCSCMHFVLCL